MLEKQIGHHAKENVNFRKIFDTLKAKVQEH